MPIQKHANDEFASNAVVRRRIYCGFDLGCSSVHFRLYSKGLILDPARRLGQ
jgi:hypothetical protein